MCNGDTVLHDKKEKGRREKGRREKGRKEYTNGKRGQLLMHKETHNADITKES